MGLLFVVAAIVVLFLLWYCCRGRSVDSSRTARAVPPLLPELTENDYQTEYQRVQASLANSFKIRWGDKVYIPFYSFHLKRMAYPAAATLELINNWIAFSLTIILLFYDSLGIAIASFVSLFVGQLIIHFTYGYNRYANPGNKFIADVEERFKEELEVSIANFEKICQMFDFLYHGKSTPSNQETCTMSLCGVFFRLLNDVAVIGVCVAIFVAIILSYCGGTMLAANEAVGNPHAENRNIAFIILIILFLLASVIVDLAFVASGTIGSIVGAVFWACFSIAGEVAGILPLVIVANVMLFLVEEYYTALLFNKSPAEFGHSILFNVFYDVISETEVVGSNLPENAKSFFDVETKDAKDETKKNNVNAESSTDDTTFDEENNNSASDDQDSP